MPQVRGKLVREVGDRTFFIRGTFVGLDAAGLLARLEAFTDELDAPAWASSLRGDFNVVIWNRPAGQLTAICDKVGAHRLYLHEADGVVSISNRWVDQIRMQRSPRLDDVGVYTLLCMCYPMDPHTVLADTHTVTVGNIARVRPGQVRLLCYHEPVLLQVQNYRTIDECVARVDRVMRQTLAESLAEDRVPLLMLSGGIDSVALLSYLTQLAPGKINTLTFAVEDQPGNELGKARIAADHYGSTHHEVVVPRAEIERLTRKALLTCDISTYGGFGNAGINEWMVRDGRQLTVFRGEDARMHTPALDLPALAGIAAHRVGLQRSAVGRQLWQARRLATAWPLRFGRNYIRYVLDRTELRDDLPAYLLKNICRFNSPLQRPLPAEVARATRQLDSASSLEQVFRAVVALTIRLQHTENMHMAQAGTESASSLLVTPFFHPDVMRAFNRVPLWMGLRPSWAPGQTSSPIPVAAKYVMRRLIADRAPPELLYRRKAVAPAETLLYDHAGQRTIFPVVRDWGPLLLEQLQGDTREIARILLQQVLEGGLRPGVPLRLGLSSCLLHLSALARLCTDPAADLEAEIEAMEPWKQ